MEFLNYDEGLCVQCMHIGSYDDEPATVQIMHEYMEAQGYDLDITDQRLHHEIYLSDARKVIPEKLKTVIRHPKLKNVLIVVKDIERSKKFYRDLFGLEMVLDNDGNMILTEGLVLQEEKYWKAFLGRDIIPENNASELYFEEPDIEGFIDRLEKYFPEVKYVNRLMTHSWGQKVIRFYDPDGNLIEVGTPV